MRLLGLLVLRAQARRPGRLLLGLLSIALGVGVVVAIWVLNRGTMQAFADSLEAISGPATLRVEGTTAGIDQTLVAEVRAVAGVQAAVPILQARVSAPGAGPGPLVVLGVDAGAPEALRGHPLATIAPETLVLLALQPDAVLLTQRLAARLDLAPGDRVTLQTAVGAREVVVAGTLAATGPLRPLADSLVLMPLARAQRLCGSEGRVDRIDVVTDPLQVAAVALRLEARLGDRARVRHPAQRGREVESILFGLRAMLSVISVFALVVGAFLVYNTVNVSLVERRRDLSMLRALGATRGQLAGLLLGEQAVLGGLGGALGLALGLWGASRSAGLLAGAITRTYFAVRLPAVQVTWDAVLLAAASGAGAALLAAAGPVRRELGGDPLDGLQGRPPGRPRPLGPWRRGGFLLACTALVAWLVLGAGSLVPHSAILGGIVSLGWLLLLAGPLTLLLVPGLAAGWRRVLGLPGHLAALSLARARERSVLTVLAVAIGCGLVTEVQVIITSSRREVMRWVDRTVAGDLMVTRGGLLEPSGNVPPFHGRVRAQLRALPGVRDAVPVRLTRLPFRGEQVLMLALSERRDGSVLTFLAGDPARALDRYLAGEGVLVTESFRATFGLGVGDAVPLPTPAGVQVLPILGVILDYSWPRGVIYLEIALYRRLYQDPLVDELILVLDEDADLPAVQAAARRVLAPAYPDVWVITNREFKAECREIIDSFFWLSHAQSLVTLVVAFFGVLGSMAIAVLQRGRELAMLRAVGATRWQVGLTLALEGGFLGLAGSLGGVLFGIWIGALALQHAAPQEHGWALPVVVPWGFELLLVGACVVTALVAALLPALRGTRWDEQALRRLAAE